MYVRSHLLKQVLREHQDFRVRAEALYSSQVADLLEWELLRGHDLQNMEGSPRHVMTKHLQVCELEQRRGLEICHNLSALY